MTLGKTARTIRAASLLGAAALAGLIIGAGSHARAGAPPASEGCKAVGNGWWNGTAHPGQTIKNSGHFNTGDQISVTYGGGGQSQGNVKYTGSLQFVGISVGWSNIPPNSSGQARNLAALVGSPQGNGPATQGVRLDQLFELYAEGSIELTVLTNSVSTQSVMRTVTCTPTPVSYPAVVNVSPLWGQPAGGTSVAITGKAFTGATAVAFGNSNASFTINSDTSITAIAPPGTGAVNVTVTTAAGPSPTSVLDQFTYAAAAPLAPTITSVSSNPGLQEAGSPLPSSPARTLPETYRLLSAPRVRHLFRSTAQPRLQPSHRPEPARWTLR
jgi:IPT/TIG domain